MQSRPTAGQASTEYIAVIALIAAVLVFAAPAVGAPDVGKAVVAKLRLALCIAGADICDARAAAKAGLAPCPLGSAVTGHELSATVFSIDIGHRTTLTVTERSDGSVGVVRTVGGHAGASGGAGGGLGAGPLLVDDGADGAARLRFQASRGWEFPSRAAADRFLEHAVLHSFNESRFPASWHSVEGGQELSGEVGVALGGKDGDASAVALSASAGQALGGRIGRGGVVTLYGRLGAEGEVLLPFRPAMGPGRVEVVVEYTVDRRGPRELAFRTAIPQDTNGNRIADTVFRLDLRDPGNLAVARGLVDAAWPWPPAVLGRIRPVFDRIGSHGTVERFVSDVEDEGWSASGSGKAGVEFGGAFKRVDVRRRLVEAGARVGGQIRRREDCVK